MKLRTPVEISQTVSGEYRIIAVAGNFGVKRIKDVNMYFMRLERQANDYLKQLIQISAELDSEMSKNIVSITPHDVGCVCVQKTYFYERLKYLTFYDYVVSLYKMNALCSMTDYLIQVANIISHKHARVLVTMKHDFFIARQYYTKQENTLKIQLTPNIHKINKAV
jgi:hypothetical protein